MTIKINENKNKTKEHSDRLFLKSKLRAKSAAAKRVWHSLTRWAEDSYLNTTKHKSGIRICRRKQLIVMPPSPPPSCRIPLPPPLSPPAPPLSVPFWNSRETVLSPVSFERAVSLAGEGEGKGSGGQVGRGKGRMRWGGEGKWGWVREVGLGKRGWG